MGQKCGTCLHKDETLEATHKGIDIILTTYGILTFLNVFYVRDS